MSQNISEPVVTLNLLSRDQDLSTEDHRALIIGQKTSTGAATAGALTSDVGRSNAEINALFGPDSHAALVARRFRKTNKYTKLDAIVLDDAGGATKATATIVLGGAATENGSLYFSIASKSEHRYEIDVEKGDDAAAILTKLETRIALDTIKPFTYSDNSTTTATLTATNGGKIANNWPLIVEGSVAGVTVALTGWNGGATDPVITSLFDPVVNVRYQTVLFPEAWDEDELKDFLQPRKNVDNDVLEGRGFIYKNEPFATVKATSLALNCSEIVIINNEPTDTDTWKGPHLPEAPDMIAAQFAAARALRFEQNASISDVVVTNAADDQFGGIHTCTLPYHNTPLNDVDLPLLGTGYEEFERRELENSGVALVGSNRSRTGVVMGTTVTTYQFDEAGNPDDTHKYLNWRDSHGIIREHLVINCREEFAQSRLTPGAIPPGDKDFVNKSVVRAFLTRLIAGLSNEAVTAFGRAPLEYFKETLIVGEDHKNRSISVASDPVMVNQLGKILGGLKFSFNTK